MRLPTVTLRDNALLYVVKLITGSMIVWYGLRAAGVAEPYWAMISLIVVTEPDVVVAKKNVRARLINTANGDRRRVRRRSLPSARAFSR